MATPIIIYDDACPMCKVYTAGFEKAGWVERTGFTTVTKAVKAHLDLNRGRHEIPLFDPETKKVTYGLEALFSLLGGKMPILKPIFAFPPLRWFLYGLYQIITYNRRVIAGTQAPSEGFDCAPDRHVPMRVLYIVLALLVIGNTFIGVTLTPLALAFFGFHTLLLGFGLVFKADRLDFAGHWTTVLFASALAFGLMPSFGFALFVSLVLWGLRKWAL